MTRPGYRPCVRCGSEVPSAATTIVCLGCERELYAPSVKYDQPTLDERRRVNDWKPRPLPQPEPRRLVERVSSQEEDRRQAQREQEYRAWLESDDPRAEDYRREELRSLGIRIPGMAPKREGAL